MALISPYLSESLSESHEQLLSHQSPLRNHSEEEMPNLKEKSRRKLFIFFLRLLNGLILLTSISLLLYSLAFVRKPGPIVYYSHFSCLYLSTCLAFQALQVYRLMCYPQLLTKRWSDVLLTGYLVILTFAGFIDGVALSFTPKPDATAISFIAFLDGLTAIVHKLCARNTQKLDPCATPALLQHQIVGTQTPPSVSKHPPRGLETDITSTERILPEARSTTNRHQSRLRRCGYATLKVCNCVLMGLHTIFVILSIFGTIELALTYRYTNPGTLVEITLASGEVHKINYNCTSVQSLNSSLPTIWLESSAAHGIVDFLGLQTSLALDHGRNSCSYDPPNFGWSDPLPVNLINYFGYFNPLLIALNRQDEEMAIVGWGGGAENALMHAIENKDTTKSLVIMDASPDGIEWFDAQRKNNWTETQMLNYRSADLNSRVFLAETILGLAIPWGLMSIFIPSEPAGYYDQSLYSRYRAQGMKEDMWAYQYYYLVNESSSPIDNYLVNTTAPATMGVYAIMSYDAGNPPTNNASNEFYRERKLEMANHIAGGNLSLPVVWCENANCSLSFPVYQPGWTADALISLGI